MYGDVVLGLKPKSKDEHDPFEVIMDKVKDKKGVKLDLELDTENLKELVKLYKNQIKAETGKDFPENPMEQLWGAIGAVFESWDTERAIAYRQIHNIPGNWGTAVNVQSMVFGNMGQTSGTGVAFTRDPATGERKFYGEYLLDAQGEDVVAGIRTPQPITRLKKDLPKPFENLLRIYKKLEKHYRDMQDMEFTIQKGKLWMLQTRTGKRTGIAAIKIAVDMVSEGLITEEEALLRIDPEQLNQLLRPVFNLQEKRKAVSGGRLLAKGLNAGPGAASGKVVFNAVDAEEWAKRGEKVILVRRETSPEDIRGMNAAEGILTSRGGMTSHAALVARQMGKVCVAGCGALEINYQKRLMRVNEKTIKEGDYISIEGTTGEVIEGKINTNPSEVLQVLLDKTLDPKKSESYRLFSKLMKWADKKRTLKIRTNADQPDQATTAISFGAEGIGLCRTEHMFFGEDRIGCMREMILAEDERGRRKALDKLLPFQKSDFKGIFKVMKGLPVTIRTL
ncbi:MAG: pyruvate, phosphate dikinase, partial [Candidatus Omnitrophica bacterium]|nr:pyruvate, phosphate dikinase [Candidatus Omnitrophota bacterium]